MAHSETMTDVEMHLTKNLSRKDALAVGELLVRVWPKLGVTAEDRADKLQVDRGSGEKDCGWESRSVLVRDGSKVVAHALMFPRTIATMQGKMTIAALASVCSDPDYRGKSLGAAVARAAFTVVDSKLASFSLFQTSRQVKDFYERLGAAEVDNTIVNSLGADPEANPFWDDIAMRYPASRDDWPDGRIDLLGPGY